MFNESGQKKSFTFLFLVNCSESTYICVSAFVTSSIRSFLGGTILPWLLKNSPTILRFIEMRM